MENDFFMQLIEGVFLLVASYDDWKDKENVRLTYTIGLPFILRFSQLLCCKPEELMPRLFSVMITFLFFFFICNMKITTYVSIFFIFMNGLYGIAYLYTREMEVGIVGIFLFILGILYFCNQSTIYRKINAFRKKHYHVDDKIEEKKIFIGGADILVIGMFVFYLGWIEGFIASLLGVILYVVWEGVKLIYSKENKGERNPMIPSLTVGYIIFLIGRSCII